MEFIIRQETGRDHERVCEVVRRAFAQAPHSDGNEHELVRTLRASPAFRPELSLVAEADGGVVGYILFTEVSIGGAVELALAPLAVLPEHQGLGIGSALVRAGHRAAARLGYRASVVLGSETYYPRFGYRPAGAFGVRAPFDAPPENFMVCSLTGDRPTAGVVRYAPEFGI